jgi:V/A-type H+-transporting ATPase subunit C
MAGINRLNYAFSVGKIRAKETKLLTKRDFLVILDLDLNSALKMIVEKSDYPEKLLEIKDSSDLEIILESELKRVLSLVKGLLIEKELIQPLLSIEASEESLKFLRDFKFDFLIDYLHTLSDLLNIKSFFRFKNLKKDKDEFSKILLDSGYIKKRIYLDCYLESWEVFLENFKNTTYASLIEESFEYFKENNSFLKLEILIENFLINQIRSAKYICLGPEPILAYYLAKKNEINLIRLLILAKLNNLPREKVLVNDTYVE